VTIPYRVSSDSRNFLSCGSQKSVPHLNVADLSIVSDVIALFLSQGRKIVLFGLPGAFTGVCSKAHVPSFLKHADSLKGKGAEDIICVSVNDPYTINAWAEKLGAKDKIKFYGDFDGKFHKLVGLDLDLTGALLGPRSQRYAAFVEDGHIKVINVEKVPSEFNVSDAETLIKSL
jgi:peroxiredoxin